MIQYLRKYPATYRRFCGWVYTEFRHTPQYLEYTKPDVTYLLLRQFFGQIAVVPEGLTTAEQLYENAKPILTRYEAKIGQNEKPIEVSVLRSPIQIEQDMYAELEEMGLWPVRDDCPF